MPRELATLLVAGLIVVLFGSALSGLQRDSFWHEEGQTAWTIRDEQRHDLQSPRAVVRFTRDSFINTFERVRRDVHPPLYFMLLDGWSLLVGESEFALRYPSALMGTIALAATYAIGLQWFNRRTALIAVLLLGTSGFMTYHCRDARMYTLYLALTTLATAAYSRWWQRPTFKCGLFYGLVMTCALYTHYVSVLVFVAHILHLIVTRRFWTHHGKPLQMPIPYVILAVLFAAWIPFAAVQLETHPARASADYLPSNWQTISQISLLLTSGYTLNYVLAFVLSQALGDTTSDRRTYHAVLLLLLCLLFPIVILLLLNRSKFALFQMRYIIMTIPAWALLLAFSIDRIRFKRMPRSELLQNATQVFLVGLLTVTQITTFNQLWPAKPRWRDAVMNAANTRSALEPALVHLDPDSPATYYDRFYAVADGISIDVGWRRFVPQEIRTLATYLKSNTSAWVILPMHDSHSWDAVAALANGRGVGYRDSVQGTIFYRFDTASTEKLSFQFQQGNQYRIPVDWTYQIYHVGDSICPGDLALSTHQHQIEISLVRDDADVLATATDTCLTVPDSDGSLHVRLSLLDDSGRRLPVVESGNYWGDFLVMGAVAASN